jgi:DNA polymerase (family 10)
MPHSNRQVADFLRFTSQLLEIRGDNVFKIRAYLRAADAVERLARPVAGMTGSELEELPGIGKNISRKIGEIEQTGTFGELEELKQEIPAPLIELLSIEGVGPKTVHTLWNRLSIQSIDDLERAARGHRIRTIRGFGEKKEAAFLASIARLRQESGRMNRIEAEAVVARVTTVLTPGTFEFAGSFRRGKSTVGDIDLITTESPRDLNPRLRRIADEVISEGDQKTSVRILARQVDIRFTNPAQFGSMLLYLTGSKAFNIKIRESALTKGYKINEYGIERRETGELERFADERAMFSFIGMDYVPPELREDWGEVEAALGHHLPELVENPDIRGDLHVHSDWSDGMLSLEQLASVGAARGYQYIACTDHTPRLHITRGLSEERLAEQQREIERVNRNSACTVLSGTEVEIQSDGTLGLPDRILGDLDIVIASVHVHGNEDRDQMTRRMTAAIGNEHVDIIGHPTGRLFGRRGPYEIDLSRVIEAAADAGTALELNASPFRLDLDDVNVKHARDAKVACTIGTDAHHESDLDFMRLGVMIARRGWCTAGDVINTRSLSGVREWLS